MRHRHEPILAWACVNAILEFAGQPDVLFGEFRATVGDAQSIDPVEAARKILAMRAAKELA